MTEYEQLYKKFQISQKTEDIFSIIWIDIDFFTRYCVRFSKLECDRIMEGIESFLTQEFAGGCMVHDHGDDEFVCRMNGMDLEAAYELTCNVLKRMRKQRFVGGVSEEYRHARITFSAGIASYPENGEGSYVLRKALSSLYLAKSKRRNSICIYQESVPDKAGRIFFDEHLEVDSILGKWGTAGIISGRTMQQSCLLWEPQAIAVYEGKLYVANQNSHQILCLDNGYVSIAAGDGMYDIRTESGMETVHLNKPTGLCVADNHLYIADTGNDRITDMDLQTGIMRVKAGCGTAGYFGDGTQAVLAGLNKPGGVVRDRYGNLYLNDTANNVIRKVDRDGIISAFAGDGSFGFKGDGQNAVMASFNEIYGLSIDTAGENLYICDYFNHRIRKINIDSQIITTVAGGGEGEALSDGKDALQAVLNRPVASCLDEHGNLYIAESGFQDVRIVTAKEHKIYTLAGNTSGKVLEKDTVKRFRLSNPNSLAVYQDTLYILDGGNNRICRIKLWKSQKFCSCH